MLNSRFFLKILLGVVLITQLAACGDKHLSFKTHGVVDADFIYISAEESGLIKNMLVHRGDQVTNGQVLATLENKQIEDHVLSNASQLERQRQTLVDLQKPGRKAEISRMQAIFEKNMALLDYLKQKRERIKALRLKGFASQDALDQVDMQIKQAQSDVNESNSLLEITKQGARNERIRAQAYLVESEKHRLNGDKSRLGKLSVLSTQNGMIFDVVHHEGEYVRQGEVIASLLKRSNLKLVLYINGQMADKLQVGDMVVVNAHDSTTKNEARITYINNQAEFNPTENYDAKNSDKMVYRVEGKFLHSSHSFRPGQPVEVQWRK